MAMNVATATGQGRLSLSTVGDKWPKNNFFWGGGGNFIKSLTNFSIQNPYNNCCQMSFPSQNTPKSMSAGASPRTPPTGELTALPQPPSWFQGDRFAA